MTLEAHKGILCMFVILGMLGIFAVVLLRQEDIVSRKHFNTSGATPKGTAELDRVPKVTSDTKRLMRARAAE